MKNENNKNGFLITWVSGIVFLLMVCFFGMNGTVKGTLAAEDTVTYTCPSGYTLVNTKYCCSSTRDNYINGRCYTDNEKKDNYCEKTVNGYNGEFTEYKDSEGKYEYDKICYDNLGSGWVLQRSAIANGVGTIVCKNQNLSLCGKEAIAATSSNFACYKNGSKYYWVEKDSTIAKNGTKVDSITSELTCKNKNESSSSSSSDTSYTCDSGETLVGSKYCCSSTRKNLKNGRCYTDDEIENNFCKKSVMYEDGTFNKYKDSDGNYDYDKICSSELGTGWGKFDSAIVHGDGTVVCKNDTLSLCGIVAKDAKKYGCYKKDGKYYWVDYQTNTAKNGSLIESITTKSSCENKNGSSSSNSNNNVTENPKTGEIAMFLIWIIGLSTIVYSVWYFRNIRKEN